MQCQGSACLLYLYVWCVYYDLYATGPLFYKKNFLRLFLWLGCLVMKGNQGDQKIGGKLHNLCKVAQTVTTAKSAKISTSKFNCKSPKHLHQTSFKTLKYLQQTKFWNCLLGKNVKKLLKQKVAQNVAISLGYFSVPKIHNEIPKVA